MKVAKSKSRRSRGRRASKLVLEAGVLSPLKWLPTVKRFGLSFASLRWNERFRPKPKHLEIVRDVNEIRR